MRRLKALTRHGLKSSLLFGGGVGFSEPPLWQLPMFTAPVGEREEIENNFEGYVQAAYKRDGIVFACITARMWVFSEARFGFQRFRNGRPGDLFGTQALSLLEQPWDNGTTGELLARMEQDVSLAGNFFATRVTDSRGERIRRLRPDWVTILTGSPSDDPFDIRARPIGYIYHPQGKVGSSDPVILTPDQVVHYSVVPDPEAQWRGMSWLTPVIEEIKSDKAATRHKLKFFENGTTSNFVVSYDAGLSKQQFTEYVEAYKAAHQGVDNAYKTIHLGGGADVTTVGADLKQLDFKATQGAGETRVAAAARVHPVIVGLSEGMQGSSLNAGNFKAARRSFADGTMRPLWRLASAALAKFTQVPPDARLWYDAHDIPFLRDDEGDRAEVQSRQAQTIRTLVDAGYNPDDVVRAVQAEDFSLLINNHSGLFSVQLQPPSSAEPEQLTLDIPTNGDRPALPAGSR